MVMTDQGQVGNRDLMIVNLYRQLLNRVRCFKYLESTVISNKKEDLKVTRRKQVGWVWCEMLGIQCDKGMSMKLKKSI